MADLRFEVHRIWNDIPRASIRHLIHSCRRRVRNLLVARWDLFGYWRFILQLVKISALNAAMNLLGLKLDFRYPLNGKFRRLARHKYTSDFNEFTRNTFKFTMSKIILIQKDYHMNFYMEQKRPFLLARSVYDMAIFYLLNNWTNRSNNIIHIWGLGMFIARKIKGCALLASLGPMSKGNGSLAKYCEYTSSSYVPKITRWGHILHTSHLNSTQFHMFYIRGSRTLVIRVSHPNVHEAVRPVVGTGLLPIHHQRQHLHHVFL